jgi:RNA recognition motif-containing protein
MLYQEKSGNLAGEASEKKESGEDGESSSEPRPRALHRTSSVFLRNLAPSITKAEIEAICKR